MTVLATGVGSLPGDSNADFIEAAKTVLDTLSLPHLPEVPGRGAHANMIGRALALVADLGADLQPAGWRLTGGGVGSGGADQRRARSLLSQDLDVVEEQAQGLDGFFKIQVAGPWTLAATVERPRGDRLLADHGARFELAQALAEGLRDHIADVRKRIPGAAILVQVDEPALPAVLAARVPTASGFGRHRSVDPQGAAPALETVFAAITESGATPIVHCCASDVPVDLFLRTGAQGISVDLDVLAAAAYDGVADAMEKGLWALLGVVPTQAPTQAPSDSGVKGVVERIERFLDMTGLDLTERLVLSPACGLAGATPQWARAAMTLSATAARELS